VAGQVPAAGRAEASESGFETKAAALIWGRDQEARIREGRWTDPNARMTTVSEWIDRWLPMQDVGISTQDSREYLIRRFIRPAWGSSPLHALSTEGITNWENGLPARAGISRRTARDARGLLCTILGDAAAHKPPLIPYNPALRPRNRGRQTGRRLERGQQRAWATPLEVLLTAERAALLFLGPDGGHHRRSNYACRVFRPACDGRYEPAPSRPARLVIADATAWPGNPVAMWLPAPATDAGFIPPRGRGIRSFYEDVPLTCWLPVKLGLTPHGLRYSHKTWMAEDGIPRSSPNSAWATRYQACAASTLTPRTACATTSRPRSRPAGRIPSAPALPSTSARRSRCSTNS
jgi:hypothetical protein